MSNICLSQMIIDDNDLEHNSKMRNPRINNHISSTTGHIELNKRSNNLVPIDESLRTLFPYLNDQVSILIL
jgi:hypothetical protein